MKGAPGEMLRDLAQPAARAGHWGHWRCACSLAARLAGCGANAAKADASQRPGACVLLLFCERIQGPENAPIARFFGLCCYQTSSELTNCREPLLLAAGWLLRREVSRKGGERLHRTASGALLASGACLRSAPWAWQARPRAFVGAANLQWAAIGPSGSSAAGALQPIMISGRLFFAAGRCKPGLFCYGFDSGKARKTVRQGRFLG